MAKGKKYQTVTKSLVVARFCFFTYERLFFLATESLDWVDSLVTRLRLLTNSYPVLLIKRRRLGVGKKILKCSQNEATFANES